MGGDGAGAVFDGYFESGTDGCARRSLFHDAMPGAYVHGPWQIRRARRQDVACLVAHQEGSGQVEIEQRCRLQQHARTRFAPRMVPIVRRPAFGVEGTGERSVDTAILPG